MRIFAYELSPEIDERFGETLDDVEKVNREQMLREIKEALPIPPGGNITVDLPSRDVALRARGHIVYALRKKPIRVQLRGEKIILTNEADAA